MVPVMAHRIPIQPYDDEVRMSSAITRRTAFAFAAATYLAGAAGARERSAIFDRGADLLAPLALPPRKLLIRGATIISMDDKSAICPRETS